jgi:hypothetical protein
MRLWRVEHKISSQHGGEGGADTAWIDVRPERPAAWLVQYGGSLSEAIAVLSRITGFHPKPIGDGFEA